MKSDRYYCTSFQLAAFIRSKGGHEILGIEPTGEGRQMAFLFAVSPELEELVDLFKFAPKDDGRLLVNVREHNQARQELLSLLKD